MAWYNKVADFVSDHAGAAVGIGLGAAGGLPLMMGLGATGALLDEGRGAGFDFGFDLLSKQKKDKESTLTPEQQAYLAIMAQQGAAYAPKMYSKIWDMAQQPQSAYEAMPDFETTFRNRYGDPMKAEYQNAISDLQHGTERHSSARKMRENSALSKYMSQVSASRENMLMNERTQQMNMMNSAMNRQQQYLGQMGSLGNLALGTKAFENIVTEQPGLFEKLLPAAQIAGTIGSFV